MWHSQAFKPRSLSTCPWCDAMIPSMYLILSSINLGLIPCRILRCWKCGFLQWKRISDKVTVSEDGHELWRYPLDSVTVFPKKDVTLVFLLFFNYYLYHVFPSVQCVRYVLKTFGWLKF